MVNRPITHMHFTIISCQGVRTSSSMDKWGMIRETFPGSSGTGNRHIAHKACGTGDWLLGTLLSNWKETAGLSNPGPCLQTRLDQEHGQCLVLFSSEGGKSSRNLPSSAVHVPVSLGTGLMYPLPCRHVPSSPDIV